jgi:hypothetical protein
MIIDAMLAKIRRASGMLVVIGLAIAPVVYAGILGQRQVAAHMQDLDDLGEISVMQASGHSNSPHHQRTGSEADSDTDRQFKSRFDGHDPAGHSHGKGQFWLGAQPAGTKSGEPHAPGRPATHRLSSLECSAPSIPDRRFHT